MNITAHRKKISIISIYVVIVAGFLVSVGFADHSQETMPCKAVQIVIRDTLGNNFIEDQEIRQLIANKFGALEGKPLSSINISLLEKIINTNPFISEAEVFSTVDGNINIEVKERIPVLRVMNYRNESFYVDAQGIFMPLSDKYTARVPVANGFIYDCEAERRVTVYDDEKSDTSVKITKVDEVFHVADFLAHNEFWGAMTEQIFVGENGDIELIPRVGNQTVIIGKACQLDEKFRKLYLFYKDGLNKTGWNKYSSINLKYQDQVVCTKK